MFDQSVSLLDPVIPSLSKDHTAIFAIEVIKSLGSISPMWIHQLISIVLSTVQITAADIQSTRQGCIYTGDRSMLSSIETLNC